jgi:hypothetical protein
VAPGGESGRPRWGADPIPIVDRIAVRNLFCLRFAELLDRLGGRRMCGDVVMHEPPAPDFHHDEDAQHAESGSRRHEEVTGRYGVGMIPHEDVPPLRGWTIRTPVPFGM